MIHKHEECCDLIQQAGLGEVVFGNTKDNQRYVALTVTAEWIAHIF